VEFLLALGVALQGLPSVYALAADTDGVDGLEEIAGAVLTPDTLDRAWQLGLSARDALANHDAHTFFGKLDQSLITGPTRTNVNDFRAILIT
jgi:hydroxypyruvate reductase